MAAFCSFIPESTFAEITLARNPGFIKFFCLPKVFLSKTEKTVPGLFDQLKV